MKNTPALERLLELLLQPRPLSARERQEYEALLQGHPEWKELVADALSLSLIVRQGRSAPPSDESLIHQVLAQRLAGQDEAALSEAERMLAQRVLADPALAARLRALEARVQALEAGSDAAAHFERLFEESLAAIEAEAAPPHPAPRPPRARPATRRQWVGAAVLSAVVLYAMLFALGRLTQPTLVKLGALSRSEASLPERLPTFRNGASAPASASDLERGLSLLRTARRAPLGLFPRYDTERLQEAARLLCRLAARGETAYLRTEAAYFLGKTYLLLQAPEPARQALRQVIAEGGRHHAEARALLDRLDGSARAT